MHSVSTATVIALEWTLLGLVLFLILARLYLRVHLQRRKLIASDCFTCLAFISGICAAALDVKLMRLGWLNPSITWSELEANTNPSAQKIMFVGWFPLLTTIYINKAGLLSFLFYIFPPTLRSISYSLWAITAYSGLSYVISIVLVFLCCLPHKEARVFNTKSQLILWTITWALHFSSDIFIFILPFPVLRTLRLNWKKKLGLYTTFGFGILSITACLARFLTVVLTYPNVPTTNIELWCALDSYVGLLVVCLPPLRPLLNLKQVSSQRSTPNDGYRGRVFDRSIGPAGSDYQLTMPPEVYSQKGPLGRPERRLPPNC